MKMLTTPHFDRPFSHLGATGKPTLAGRWFAGTWRRWTGRQVPAPRDRVREAAEVRELAVRVQRSDPRFADDLFAAADRHERTAD